MIDTKFTLPELVEMRAFTKTEVPPSLQGKTLELISNEIVRHLKPRYISDNSWDEERTRQYLKGLKDGELVYESTPGTTFFLRLGVVYRNANGFPCVKWDAFLGENRQMGTAATWGTRRVIEA